MIDIMLKRLLTPQIRSIAVAVVLLASPATLLAQDADKSYDARLEGHTESVTLDAGGTALTFILLIILGGLCVGVTFKNANRSHLD